MEQFNNIIQHEFFLAFYGIIMWFAVIYGKEKKANKKLKFMVWFKNNNTDILIGVIVAFAVVAFDDELVAAYNSFAENDITLARYMYLLPGVAVNMIYKALSSFKPSE